MAATVWRWFTDAAFVATAALLAVPAAADCPRLTICDTAEAQQQDCRKTQTYFQQAQKYLNWSVPRGGYQTRQKHWFELNYKDPGSENCLERLSQEQQTVIFEALAKIAKE